MEAFFEIRDANRRVKIVWRYNSGTAQVTHLFTGEDIGTFPVLMPANPSIPNFTDYLDQHFDKWYEAVTNDGA